MKISVPLTWVVFYFFVPFRFVAFYFQSSFTSLLLGRDFYVRVTFSSITLSLELPLLKVGCTPLQENLINLTHSLAGALCPCVCWVHVIPAILLGVLALPSAKRGGSVCPWDHFHCVPCNTVHTKLPQISFARYSRSHVFTYFCSQISYTIFNV